MPKRKDDYDRLKDQVKIISGIDKPNIINALKSKGMSGNPIDPEYHPHTILKLCYLNYYLDIFTKIAKKYFDKVVFIDAFGGSGFVKIKNTEYYVYGSSVLAYLNRNFHEVISIDIEPDRSNLLKERLNIIKDVMGGIDTKINVITGDVNTLIHDISDEITQSTCVLLFIDPEGLEPNFSELLNLTNKSDFIDLLLNKNWGIYRLDGKIKKEFRDKDIEKMKAYLSNYQEESSLDNTLLEFFEKSFGKPMGNEVKIKSKGEKVEYSIILRVRKTKKDSTWIKSMEDFGSIIEKYNGETSLTILEEVNGSQNFFV